MKAAGLGQGEPGCDAFMAKLTPQEALGWRGPSETPRVGPLYPITGLPPREGPSLGEGDRLPRRQPWGGLGRQQDSGSWVGASSSPMDRNHSVRPRRCPEVVPHAEKRAWEILTHSRLEGNR